MGQSRRGGRKEKAHRMIREEIGDEKGDIGFGLEPTDSGTAALLWSVKFWSQDSSEPGF
jgi:hypothetical protein